MTVFAEIMLVLSMIVVLSAILTFTSVRIYVGKNKVVDKRRFIRAVLGNGILLILMVFGIYVGTSLIGYMI